MPGIPTLEKWRKKIILVLNRFKIILVLNRTLVLKPFGPTLRHCLKTKNDSINSTYVSKHDMYHSHFCVFCVSWMEGSLCCDSVLGKAANTYKVKLLALFEGPYILKDNLYTFKRCQAYIHI